MYLSRVLSVFLSKHKHIREWLQTIIRRAYYNEPTGIVKIGNCGSGGTPNLLSWLTTDQLTIGKYCMFAHGVTILMGGEHDSSKVTCFGSKSTSKGPVNLGNDVWIGEKAIILSGVTIGDGAIIGAGSVVTHDIPAYAIAAGNPAKIIRHRFSPEQIRKLLEIAWWNWTDADVRKYRVFLHGDVDVFIKRFHKQS